MNKWPISGCGTIIIVIVLIVGAFFGIKSCNRSSELQPFEDYLDEYLNISELEQSLQAPYIIGKVITIDKPKRKIDYIYFDLPEELRATNPEGVGTVVWLEWGKHVVGMYEGGADAYVRTCDVTIIDKSNAAIVGKQHFVGSDPPRTKSHTGPGYGSKPTQSIVEYIKMLPQK